MKPFPRTILASCLLSLATLAYSVNALAGACDLKPGQRPFISSKGAWDRVNSPSNISPNFNYVLSSLPMSGKLADEDTPWSETYWPASRGGIAIRWQDPKNNFGVTMPDKDAYLALTQAEKMRLTPNEQYDISRGDFSFTRTSNALRQVYSDTHKSYRSPTREELMRMSADEISRLSATEKFDIARGRYDYPFTKKILADNQPTAPDWYGICHGWTPAAYNHREPVANAVKNPDGLEVLFGSSDVKGLLSYYYTNTKQGGVYTSGRKCRDSKSALGSMLNSMNNSCTGLNAGSFHVITANMLGIQKKGFGMEIDPGHEIWNQPVYSFESKELSRTRQFRSDEVAPGTVERVIMETTVLYADDGEEYEIPQRMYPVVGTPEFAHEHKTYQYYLDLDANGRIIGGQWIVEGASCAKMPFPDFIWTKKQQPFVEEFEILNKIYKSAN